MSKSPIVVIGAGGHASVVIDLIERIGGYEVTVCEVDPKKAGARILDYLVEPLESVDLGIPAVIAVGDNSARARIAGTLKGRPVAPPLVHPRATVAPTVRLGQGTVVMAGAVVNPRTTIGAHVIINTSASVDHDCSVGDAAHICPGAHLAGGVVVGSETQIGTGANVVPYMEIGSGARVGAGAVVIQNVPDGVFVAGVPARVAW